MYQFHWKRKQHCTFSPLFGRQLNDKTPLKMRKVGFSMASAVGLVFLYGRWLNGHTTFQPRGRQLLKKFVAENNTCKIKTGYSYHTRVPSTTATNLIYSQNLLMRRLYHFHLNNQKLAAIQNPFRIKTKYELYKLKCCNLLPDMKFYLFQSMTTWNGGDRA